MIVFTLIFSAASWAYQTQRWTKCLMALVMAAAAVYLSVSLMWEPESCCFHGQTEGKLNTVPQPKGSLYMETKTLRM